MMKWSYFLSLAIAASFTVSQPLHAATNFWQDKTENVQARTAADITSVNVSVKKGRHMTASLEQMSAAFLSNSNRIISLPLPDGSMVSYQFSRSSVMPDALAAKYPQIQTFKAFDVNNPSNRGSFDITPQGFHGMFQHNGKWVFIDPEFRNENGNYVAYYGRDAQPLEDRPEDKVIKSDFLSVTEDTPYSNRPFGWHYATNLPTCDECNGGVHGFSRWKDRSAGGHYNAGEPYRLSLVCIVWPGASGPEPP